MFTTWSLVFSLIPLAFMTVYSSQRVERAMNAEMGIRLNANAREIDTILHELHQSLSIEATNLLKSEPLKFYLKSRNSEALKIQLKSFLLNSVVSEIAVFDSGGRHLFSVSKNNIISSADVNQNFTTTQVHNYIDEKISEFIVLENNALEIRKTVGVRGSAAEKNRNNMGFLRLSLPLNKSLFMQLQSRLGVEMIFCDYAGNYILGTHEDFKLFTPKILADFISHRGTVSDYRLRGHPFGFSVYPISNEISSGWLVLGAEKIESNKLLAKVNRTFYLVILFVLAAVIIATLITSRWILRPLDELIFAIKKYEKKGEIRELPIKSDNEIGLLTESFNGMMKSILSARRELEHKVKELEVAQKEIRESQAITVQAAKMASLGQLVAGVAHELNNPIGFIYSNIQHLRDYSDRLVSYSKEVAAHPEKKIELEEKYEIDYIKKDLPKLLDSCEEGARRTRDIVQNLRKFSRADSSLIDDVDIEDCIDSTLSLIPAEILNRIVIRKNFRSIPKVKSVRAEMNQIFMNLITNAIQAISAAGTIEISAETVTVDNKRYVEVKVSDTGAGISPENLSKIFDPFFTTKSIGEGTGLGLSIVYALVKKQGGDIKASSQLHVGTEFRVFLAI